MPDWPDDVTPDQVLAWVDSLRPTYGHTLDITPLDPADHTVIDPISELGLLGVAADKVIIVRGD